MRARIVFFVAALTAFTAWAGTVNNARTGNPVGTTGTFTAGHCLKASDTQGTLQDAGAACGTGSGTVTSVSSPNGTITVGTPTTTPTLDVVYGTAANTAMQGNAGTQAAIVPNTAPAAGATLIGNAGGTSYVSTAISQDCTLASTGAITCTKTNNVALTTAATTALGTSGATIPLNNGNNTFSGADTISTNGAASTPPLFLTGSILTGGTGTTNFPNFFIQPSGATGATTWSTSGTPFGINAASGFAGNFIDFRINGGSSLFRVDGAGDIVPAGALFMASAQPVENSASGNNAQIKFQTTGLLGQRNIADSNPVFQVQNVNASSTGDILQLLNSATTVWTATVDGHISTKMTTAPTVATGATDCGTSPAIAGNDNVGRVTVGSSTNGGKCTLTFNKTWATNAPVCTCDDETTTVLCSAKSTSTTTTALTGVFVAGDSVSYVCTGYR